MFFVLVLILLATFLYLYDKKTKSVLSKDILGPPTLPFLGNAHLCFGTSIDFFNTARRVWKEYGSLFRIYIGWDLLIVFSDPKDVEVILSSNALIQKSDEYKFFYPWLGTGLLTASGDKWRKHRKVITPTFHFKILENFINVFNRQSEVFVNKLEQYVDKGTFDVYNPVTLCTLDIICETAMGVSVDAQNTFDSIYVKAVLDMCKVVRTRMSNPMKRFPLIFYFSPEYKMQKNALAVIHGLTDKTIVERKEILKNKNYDLDSYTKQDDVYGAKKKMAFLDMLLLSTVDGKPMPDEHIREEVNTFMFEGHDTTASAISFALYLLSLHPDEQKKVYQEQKEIFGDDLSRPPTYEDLMSMKYLEMVIKESLRIYPPVPWFGRHTKEDMNINGMTIPANTTLMVLNFCMQMDPKVFPDPEKFNPERFLPDECNKRNPFAFVVFSAGPRNCIGQKFAMLEMKSMLSKIVRSYKLLPSGQKVSLTADLILKSITGVHIQIKKRP